MCWGAGGLGGAAPCLVGEALGVTFEPAPEELEGPRHAMILGASVLTEGTAGAKP